MNFKDDLLLVDTKLQYATCSLLAPRTCMAEAWAVPNVIV